ncbi:MAG: hypothetical protein D6798_10245 [Deltaproteobacteria bacterium]|nr:MAG: hypothetical protein D6798_10245 [Deltaproteobacteria bacterium]
MTLQGRLQTSFIVPFSFAQGRNDEGLAALPAVAERVPIMVAALRAAGTWQRSGRLESGYFHRSARAVLGRFTWLRWTGPQTCAVVLQADATREQTIPDLHLEVELALHATGIGLLITTLSREGLCAPDVLLLNERFRILEQAWGGQFLPRAVDIGQTIAVFDGSQVDGWHNGWVRHLLGPLIGGVMDWRLTPHPDPRAFVHTWWGLPHPPTDALWEPFSWVDAAPGSSARTDDATMAELRRDVDYRRWWEGGTRYGITRYSFACMQQVGPGRFDVSRHMAGTYRDLVCLQLLRQARLIDLEEEASRLARHLSGPKPHDAVDDARRLRAHLLQYATAQDLRMPVHQEQGIDLADRLARQLRLDELHDTLHRDAERAERWLSEAATNRLSHRVGQLTLVLAAVGVWAGFAGANGPDQGLLSLQGSWPWPFAPGVVPFVLVNVAAAVIIIAALWAGGRLVDHLRGLD